MFKWSKQPLPLTFFGFPLFRSLIIFLLCLLTGISPSLSFHFLLSPTFSICFLNRLQSCSLLCEFWHWQKNLDIEPSVTLRICSYPYKLYFLLLLTLYTFYSLTFFPIVCNVFGDFVNCLYSDIYKKKPWHWTLFYWDSYFSLACFLFALWHFSPFCLSLSLTLHF